MASDSSSVGTWFRNFFDPRSQQGAEVQPQGGQGPSESPMAIAQAGHADAQNAGEQGADDPSTNEIITAANGSQTSDGTTTVYTVDPITKVVVIPAGTSISNVQIDGKNLVLTQPDGTVVIIEAAIYEIAGVYFVPTIIIGDIELSPTALAQALGLQETNVAAAPQEGSGGDLSAPPGDIGPIFDLTSLLPPTAFGFEPLVPRELLEPVAEEESPSIAPPMTPVLPPDNDVGLSGLNPESDGGEFSVDEDDLLNGTSPSPSALTQTETFSISAPDGLGSLQIGSTTISPSQLNSASSTNPIMIGGTQYGDLKIIGYDPSTGVVTYTYELTGNTLDHGPANNGENSIFDNIPVTVTDVDGDSATGTLSVQVVDDVALAGLGLADGAVATVDESLGENGLPETEPSGTLGQVKVPAGDLFVSSAKVGADNGDINYSLSLTGSDVGSGLYAVDPTVANGQGQQIVLNQQPDGTIIGTSSLGTHFTISIDPDGNVTFTQSINVWHSNTADHDDASVLTTSSANVFQVVQTVTDGDGDVDTATVDLGAGLFVFEDDGPSATLTLGPNNPMLIVDESVGADASDPNADDETHMNAPMGAIGYAEVAGATLFNVTSAVGEDDEGATTVFSLNVVGTGLTNLTTTDGQIITLQQVNDTTINGVASGGATVFTVTIDAMTGDMTLAQFESLNHPTSPNNYDEQLALAAGSLQAVLTVTDGDGDVATSSVDLGGNVIKFEDDGPSATLTLGPNNPMLIVDESVGADASDPNADDETHMNAPMGAIGYAEVAGATLFNVTSAVGEDDEGATTVFSLNVVGTGLTNLTTTDGQIITLQQVNDTTINGVASGGATVFTVTIDAMTGDMTLAQFESLNHPTSPNNYDEQLALAAGSLQAVLTVTDGDGDVATSSVDLGGNVIKFEDDGPSATLTLGPNNPMLIVDESVGADASDPNADDETHMNAPMGAIGYAEVAGATLFNVTSAVGEDDEGATTVFSLNVVGTGLTNLTTTDGQIITLQQVNDTTINGVASGGATVFTVTIDAMTGDMTLAQFESLNHPTSPNNYDEQLALAAGSLQAVLTVTDGDGDVATSSVDLGGNVIKFEDDGPSATLTLGPNNPMLIVDESVGADASDPNADDETHMNAPMGAIGYAEVAGATLFNVTSAVGEDDEGATTVFSLNVVGTGLTNLTTTDGQIITLQQVNDTTINGVASGGATVFTVTIDAMTGDMTLAQFESLNHPTSPNNYDEQLALAAGSLQAVLTVTDGDGDVATSSVDLGGNVIKFEDDGPSATLTLGPNNPMLIVDESVGADASDPNADDETHMNAPMGAIGYAEVAGATLFNVTSAVGEDDEGATTVFSLNVVGTGLTNLTTTDGQIITLQQVNDTTINGVASGGATVFTVTIDAMTGDMTLAQFESLNHPTSPNNYDEQLALAAGSLQAVLTVTDGDGDVATSSVDLGGNVIKFEDDGPSATLTLGPNNPMLIVDESVGADASDPNADDETHMNAPMGAIGYAEVAGATLFNVTSAVGEDDEGATTVFSLNVVGTGLTNLTTTDGQIITLQQVNDTTINGVASGGATVFTVTIDAMTGDMTLAQFESLNHPTSPNNYDEQLALAAGSLQAVLTVTDGDGDVATSSVDLGGNVIKFEDDGPSATLTLGPNNPMLIVDESVGADASDPNADDETHMNAPMGAIGYAEVAGATLFNVTSAVGEDDEGATTVFSLNVVGTGLTNLTTTDGQIITLQQVNDTTINGVASGGATVFTVTIDAMTGDMTLAQFESLNHPTSPNNYDEQLALAAGSLQAVLTVTDGDGDVATSSVDLGGNVIKFEDDGPSATLTLGPNNPMLIVDESVGADASDPNADDETHMNAPMGAIGYAEVAGATLFNVTSAVGEDDEGATTVFSLNVVGTGLTNLTTTDGQIITLQQVNDTTINGVASGGATVFTVTIDAMTGDMTLAQFESLNHPTSPNNYDEQLALAAGSLQAVLTVTDGDGDVATSSVDLGGNVIKFEDDGPSATLTLGPNNPMLIVDESVGADASDPNADDETHMNAPMGAIGYAEVAGATLFNVTSAVGEDDEGATTVFSLNVVGTGLTNLTTTDGQIITLQQVNDTTINGVASGGATVFTVTIDAMTGDMTLAQFESLNHPTSPNNYDEQLALAAGSLQAVLTVTDGDGDVATSSVDLGGNVIKFEDDGPSATLTLGPNNPMLIVDESVGADASDPNADDETHMNAPMGAIGYAEVAGATLFNVTSAVGEDDEGATTVFSLNVVGTGLTNLTTTDGQIITLQQVNDTTINGVASGGATVFTVTIDAMTGDMTLAQFESLNHPTSPNNYDEQLALAAGSLQAVLTVTDGDGDVATSSVDLGGNVIKFEDDGPSATLTLGPNNPMLIVDESVGADASDPNADDETHMNAPMGAIGYAEVAGATLFNVTSAVGEDDEGATTVFSLNVVGTGLTNLTTTDGQIITLQQVNDTTINGVASGGATVFTVTIDAMTGDMTLAQFESLNHPTSPNNYDEQLALAAGSLQAVLTVTDGDGDVATSSVDLGGNVIKFEDDGPSATLTLGPNNPMLIVDESVGADASDPNADDETHMNAPMGAIGYAEVAGATLFNVTSAVGEDDEGATTVFSLNVVGTGLTNLTTTDGQIITLQQVNDTTINGVASGGATVFTVTIDAMTGDMTLAQFESLNHPTSPNNYDEQLALAAGSLQAVLTVTDGDGDVATSSVDLGGNVIKFEDDGPSATLTLGPNNPMLIVDETAGVQNDGTNSNETGTGGGLGQATIAAGALFVDSSVFGSDGEATSNATVYTLVIDTNVATGLTDTATSQAVVLVDNAGVIEGRTETSNELVFTVEVNAAGDVTLTQFRALVHDNSTDPDEAATPQMLAAGALALEVEVTDGDGDKDTASIDLGGGVIKFEDDGPTASTVIAQGQTDDEDKGDFAADSNIDNGSGDVPGAPGIVGDATAGALFSAGADGLQSIVFTDPNVMAIYEDPATGLALQEGLNFQTTTSGSDTIYTATGITSSQVVFVLTVSANGSYAFEQQAPLVHGTNEPEEIDDLSLQIGFTVTDGDGDQAQGSLTINIDDDTPTIADPNATDPNASDYGFSDLTVPNAILKTSATNDDFSSGADGWQSIDITGPTIEGIAYITVPSTDNEGNPVVTLVGYADGGDPATDRIFEFTVEGDGDYCFNLIEPEGSTTTIVPLAGVDSGNNSFVELADLSIEFSANNNGTVNSSVAGLGVNDQFIENGEALTMEFYDPGLVGDDDPNNLLDGAIEDTSITSITFENTSSGGNITYTVTNTVTGQTLTVTNFNVASGSPNNPSTFTIDPGFSFNVITIEGETGSKLRLKSGAVEKTVLPQDQEFDFTVTATDGDGDTVTDDVSVTIDTSLPVTLVGDGTSNTLTGTTNDDTLSGLGGDDILSGLAGNDLLDGGAGADTMTGGAGADTFVISADTLGPAIEDVITDYNFGDGDIIDLTELLNVALETSPGTPTDLSDSGTGHVTLFDDGGTTKLGVDVDGGGDNYVAVATLTGLATTDSVTILFDDGNGNTGTDVV